jgi:hypothetical protein
MAKTSVRNFKVSELLAMVETEKIVRPIYQRNFVTTSARQKEIVNVINSGEYCGTLILRKVGNIFELMDGNQRLTIAEKTPDINLDYVFPCLIYSDISDIEALQIFEDINGKFRTTLKNSEIAKNHLEMPLNWQLADSFENLHVNTKRYDNASLYQYTCQLFAMVEADTFTDFDLNNYDSTPEIANKVKEALNFLISGIVKEKWNLSQLPFFLYFADKAKEAGHSNVEYQGFLQDFLASQGNNAEIFKANCKNGTTKKGNIIARFTALKAEFESANIKSCCYRIPESKKAKIVKNAKTQREIELEKKIAELKKERLELIEIRKAELENIENMALSTELLEV